MEEESLKYSRQRSEKKYANSDFSCFGEYGSKVFCKDCANSTSCKNFTNEQKKTIYLRTKGKYKGRGKWSRKDLY